MKTQRAATQADIDTNEAVRKDGLKVGDMAWFDDHQTIKTAQEIFIEYNSNDEPWLHEDDVIGAMEDYASQFYTEAEVREIMDKALEFIFLGVQTEGKDFIKNFDYSHLLTKNK